MNLNTKKITAMYDAIAVSFKISMDLVQRTNDWSLIVSNFCKSFILFAKPFCLLSAIRSKNHIKETFVINDNLWKRRLITPLLLLLYQLSTMPRERGIEWEHVTDPKTGGKAIDGQICECKFCNLHFIANAYRIRHHLMGNIMGSTRKAGVRCCPRCPSTVKTALLHVEDSKQTSITKKRAHEDLDRVTSQICSTYPSNEPPISLSSATMQTNIKYCLQKQDKSQVDEAVARAFYANGLPFQLLKDQHFKEAIGAIATFGSTYSLPGYNSVRTTLLCKEKEKIEKQLGSFKDGIIVTGCTIASDGWTDTCHRPLLNMMCVSPMGEQFLFAVDTSGKVKDAFYLEKMIGKAIESVGVEHVHHIVTDSAAVMKQAGEMLQRKYPKITWTPCTAHCLDLLLEDFGKMSFIGTAVNEAKEVVHFLTNHHMSNALFKQISTLNLLKPAETRFATNFIMLQRLIQVRDALEKLMYDDFYRDWACKGKYKIEAAKIKSYIMNPTFWHKCAEAVAVSEAIVKLMRQCDKGVPNMGKIYHGMWEVGESLKKLKKGGIQGFPDLKLTQARFVELESAWNHRWAMLHSPMHAAGYVLDPEFQNQTYGQSSNKEVMDGFNIVLDRMVPDANTQTLIVKQLSKYRHNEGIFDREVTKACAAELLGWKWWEHFGSGCPELQEVAIKVLAQCSVASACERNWSTYDFIHSKKRNKLAPERANDLVFVFSNLRLSKKIRGLHYEEEMVQWMECDNEDDTENLESSSQIIM